jgi:hypothetical protein
MQLGGASRRHLDRPWPAAAAAVGAQPERPEAQRIAVRLTLPLDWWSDALAKDELAWSGLQG